MPGEGVTGVVDGRRVAVGNLTLMRRLGVALGSNVEHAHTLRAEGHTVTLVAVDGPIVGLVDVSDPIKASTPAARWHAQDSRPHFAADASDAPNDRTRRGPSTAPWLAGAPWRQGLDAVLVDSHEH
jgi:hypothetical protein